MFDFFSKNTIKSNSFAILKGFNTELSSSFAVTGEQLY